MAQEIFYLSNHSEIGEPDDDMRYQNCDTCDTCYRYNNADHIMWCANCERRTAWESEEDYKQFDTEEEAEEWDSLFVSHSVDDDGV